jgi:hypothetical protein
MNPQFSFRYFIILFTTTFLISCKNNTTENTSAQNNTQSITPTTNTPPQPGTWLDTLDKITDNPDCVQKIKQQLSYLNNEHLSDSFTHDKFSVSDSLTTAPKDVNTASLRSAAEFKTRLHEELKKEGVNFAGHYSLVAVGMTGWGANYWIIDRRNGKAYEFPYKATYISFRKNSNLIILNPKEGIMDAMRNMYDYTENCAYIANGYASLHTDLRPFYFVWKNNKLELLGPKNIQPPMNTFWKDYFGN